MRCANVAGRMAVITGPDGAELLHDVAQASEGRFGPAPQDVYEQWVDFAAWAHSTRFSGGVAVDLDILEAPSPTPCQVFAIGLNYAAHADEAGFTAGSAAPPVFTKFPSCIAGPRGELVLPSDGHVDWEVELVAVLGRRAHRVTADEAMQYVAGYTLGQDVSERIVQMAATPPQFSLGKSLPGFGPTGPWLVTLDEFDDPDDLELGCRIDDETVQCGRTRDMISSVARLIELLSASVVLLPGDIVFTGTPDGVGMGREPQRWLQPGDVLTSWAAGIGSLRQVCVADRRR